jgi:hypothetical protein
MNNATLPVAESSNAATVKVTVSRVVYLAQVSQRRSYGETELFRVTAHGDGRASPVEFSHYGGARSETLAPEVARSFGEALIAAADAVEAVKA